jgi:cell fate (sporulation/competence/biofilm development) regulator YlbF (YheA/YmcA/DUF963 family)
MVTTEHIIEKIVELSAEFKNHPVYAEFTESAQQMRDNPDSGELFEKLVYMGKELDAMVARGEQPDLAHTDGYMELKERLDGDRLVKSYIEAQRAYIGLLQAVMERIYRQQ